MNQYLKTIDRGQTKYEDRLQKDPLKSAGEFGTFFLYLKPAV